VEKGRAVVQRHADDMGEDAAGTRISELLELSKGVNVLVLVSRECYGGMLGGIRFGHFLHCARRLLLEHGYDARVTAGSKSLGKSASSSRKKAGKSGKMKGGAESGEHASQKEAGRPGGYELRPGAGGAPLQLHYVPTKHQASYTKAHMEHG
jgi:hypothetical protein